MSGVIGRDQGKDGVRQLDVFRALLGGRTGSGDFTGFIFRSGDPVDGRSWPRDSGLVRTSPNGLARVGVRGAWGRERVV